MKIQILLIVAAHLSMVSVSAAQKQADPWIGKRVITKDGTVLRIGDKTVDDKNLFRIYLVEDVQSRWIGLKDQNSGIWGWVPKENVILIENAVEYFTKQINVKPNALLYVNRAAIHLGLGEVDDAIADFSEAIRLEPKDATFYCSRGGSWTAKKNYERALADYDQSIKLDPKLAGAYYNRGLTWYEKCEFDKAIADYSEAIRLAPIDAGAYINRGNAWQIKKDYNRAIADFDQAIRLDPGYFLPYFNRGNALSDKGDYLEAVAEYDEVIRLVPNYFMALFNRAFAFEKLKKYGKAIDDYYEIIRKNPKDYVAFNALAWLLATCPDEDYVDGKRALEMSLKACELSEWKFASTQSTLAAAYAELGDFAKAVEWQEKAHQLFSDEDKKRWQKFLDLYRAKKKYRRDQG